MSSILHQQLLEWTLLFVKNRDLYRREIESIEQSKNGFDMAVTKKKGVIYYLVRPQLEPFIEIEPKLDDKKMFIVVFNTKANLKSVIAHWDVLKEYKNLGIIFTNPGSTLEKQWILSPHTHAKITEGNALKSGLKTLFETVDPFKGDTK